MHVSISMIEKAARAMYRATQLSVAGSVRPQPWGKLDEQGQQVYRAEAAAALATFKPALKRAEKRGFQRGWAECSAAHKHD
jgi:hypothetical protein